jgi:hypothetical protein
MRREYTWRAVLRSGNRMGQPVYVNKLVCPLREPIMTLR